MKAWFSAAFVLALAACTPPQQSAQAPIEALYATVQQNIGATNTTLDAIPMTDDLRALLDRAETATVARGEPFIEGDVAANCQDCRSLSDLVIGAQTGAYQEPTASGHQWVQASFTLNGDETRTMLYDMIETPEGWRVDNILTEGLNLRTEAEGYLADAEAAATP